MTFRFMLLLVFLPIGVPSQGQNLVKDPGFEEMKPRRCPSGISEADNVLRYWHQPTDGTTDYFNSCADERNAPNVGVPRNRDGYQNARTGDGYIGFVNHPASLSWLGLGDPEFEYIQGELKEELVSGRAYQVSFYVSLAERNEKAAKHLGAYFGKEKVRVHHRTRIDVDPQIRSEEFIEDTAKWQRIEGTFQAEGGEEWIIIGCFGDNDSFKKTGQNIPGMNAGAYYYLEDVSVEPVGGESTVTTHDKEEEEEKDQDAFDVGDTLTLPDVTFEVDQWHLRKDTLPALDSLATFMKQHPNKSLKISGHTDSTGREEKNLELSRKRADRVRQYLKEGGVDRERMVIEGHGSKRPVATNETEKGRAKNRRVELGIEEDLGCEKCDIPLVRDTEEHIDSLSENALRRFLCTFDSSCTNNVEFSEYGNEVLHQVFTKYPEKLVSILSNGSDLEKEPIYHELEHPVHDHRYEPVIPLLKKAEGDEEVKERLIRAAKQRRR